MDKVVRLGVIGVGGMGSAHARSVLAGNIKRMRLTAVCDTDTAKMESFPAEVKRFSSTAELLQANVVDAVLIATPHYAHTTIGIEVLQKGVHLLVEKPISVHKSDCERLIAAHSDKSVVFAAMFNQRTDPYYRKIRDLISQNELGKITRVNWVVTNWFRTQFYYETGTWRATWSGEGGGVLLNQSPHNLDLMQWLCGMPARIRAFCHLGKYHDVEVEDDVTAYMEYANGATGTFITSTGEAPGCNRLEISGDRGRLIFEKKRILFERNEIASSQFITETKELFAQPTVWQVEIPPYKDGGQQHNGILTNFADAILDGAPLIAPAAEGIHSVELANAMLLSSLEGEMVELPLDGARFAKRLQQLIADSRFVKKETTTSGSADLSTSFNINT